MVSLLDYVNDLEDLIKVKTLTSSDLFEGAFSAFHKGGELIYSWNTDSAVIPEGDYVCLDAFSVYPYSLVEDESFVFVLMDVMRAFVGRYPEFDFYLQVRYDMEDEDVYLRIVFPLFGDNADLIPGGPYGYTVAGKTVKKFYFACVNE